MVEVGKVVIDGEFRQATPREIASTIAHELVHVKQYIRREFGSLRTSWCS
jgi:predicted Zn-dependent protease